MSSFRPALCTGLVAALLLAAPAAEARFGKKSSDTSDDSRDDDKKDSQVHDATAITAHDATPIPKDPPPPPQDDDSDDHPRAYRRYRGPSHTARLYGDEPVVTTVDSVAPEEDVAMAVQTRAPANPIDVRVGVNVGALGGGTVGDVYLGIEGAELGLDVQGSQLVLPTDDGTAGTDKIALASVHLTWSPVSTERMRWRLGAGFGTASAPDIFLAGPSLTTSLEACVAGPLDVEARVQAVPAVYRQLDVSAGLAVHLGTLHLRGGWRALVLDDAGRVDGVQHVDAFTGPYGGAGFVF